MEMTHIKPDCLCSGKCCSSCKIIKCVNQFCRNRSHKDGRNNNCKACTKAIRVNQSEQIKTYQQSYNKAYIQKNREAERLRANVKNAAAKARKHHAQGTFTVAQWKDLREQYAYTCLKCGRKEPDIILTVDHVIPLSRGGTNYIENIQPLCRSCNTSKFQASTDYRLAIKGITQS